MSLDYRNTYFTVWLYITMQAMALVMVLFPVLACAVSLDVNTIQGLDTLMSLPSTENPEYQSYSSPSNEHEIPPLVSLSTGTHSRREKPPVPAGDLNQHKNLPPLIPDGLPDLYWKPGKDSLFVIPKDNEKERQVNAYISGIMRAGSVLSAHDKTDATIRYAREVGEGLINQRVNDWLNQFGNARVSLNADLSLSGDMLLPLYDSEQSLLFSHLDSRRNQDRNIINVGLGYSI
ncbi:TPA: inverse autotransporter beta domain-containing protein [Klebsiella aerogenes]|nr:inverse autotransporter beta domain-containing protein [Klebsiella aerogenes]